MKNCEGSLTLKTTDSQSVDGGANPTSSLHISQIRVRVVDSHTANRIFVKNHYAHRAVPISRAYAVTIETGAKRNPIVGAISFGKPASYTLCNGIAGKENSHRIYELNRLWIDDICPKNSESYVIGCALRFLKKEHPDWILVSFADSEQNHTGAIYRATNWIYTGKTKKHILWNSGSGKHGRHTSCEDKSKPHMRSEKHRYVYFFNKDDIKLLKYPIIKFEKINI